MLAWGVVSTQSSKQASQHAFVTDHPQVQAGSELYSRRLITPRIHTIRHDAEQMLK
jgi:hypothetical protein